MVKLFANSGDPDQMRHVLLHLIWVCTVCQFPFYGSPDYNGLKKSWMSGNSVNPDIPLKNMWC